MFFRGVLSVLFLNCHGNFSHVDDCCFNQVAAMTHGGGLFQGILLESQKARGLSCREEEMQPEDQGSCTV